MMHQEKTNYNVLFILFVPIFFGCMSCQRNPYPPEVQAALNKAGDNREQLIKVIEHYSSNPADSLKRKAAFFLIANMRSQYTYHGDGLTFTGNGRNSYEVFAEKLGKHSPSQLNEKMVRGLYNDLNIEEATQAIHLRNDLKFISASYLINNIDQAFDAWRSYPWSQHVSFDDFCNFILPYNVYSEPLDHWRKKIRKRYSWVTDSLDNPNNLWEATRLLNQAVKPKMDYRTPMLHVPGVFNFDQLQKAGAGKCEHLNTYNAYVLRAMGIPARIDYVPAWSSEDFGHSWLAVENEENKLYAFDAIYNDPDRQYKRNNIIPQVRKYGKKAPKVFRQTFRMQPLNLAGDTTDLQNVPRLFANHNRIDVTSQYYMPTRTLSVRADTGFHGEHAYLSVFSRNRWKIIDKGSLDPKRGRYTFSEVGQGILYLPVQYDFGGMSPISYPLIASNKIKLLDPNWQQTRSLHIDRKYPVKPYVEQSLNKMIGGVFQGANRKDFSDARTLFKIREMPRPKTNRYEFYNNGPYRYLRFKIPDDHCRVAEMYFMNTQQGNASADTLDGSPISSPYSTEEGPGNTTDGNILSYFVAKADSGGWVGVDLGSPQRVTGVQFYPPNDGNSIEKGDEYKLFYWDYGWKSAWKKKRASGEQLVFHDVPGSSLFILRNLTKGNDEGVFTYKDGSQIWW